jgi:hypothetical protein
MDGSSTEIERPNLAIEDFLSRGAEALDCQTAELVGRSKEPRLVEARQILTIVAVERYGFLVKTMAAAFSRYGETASRWISRGTSRRKSDDAYRDRIDRIDRAIAAPPDREDGKRRRTVL